jgi:hypothetical protein
VSELERALVAVGRELDVPGAPDFVPGVLAAIEPRRARAWAPPRRVALVVAVVLVALLGATLAIPEARSTLLRIFDIGGGRIERVDDLPEVPIQEDPETGLGDRSTLEEAKALSRFPLRELENEPDRVYLGDRGTVWFLYGDPERPRLLVSQTPLAIVDAPALQKKLVAQGTSVELVDVDGRPGAFLSGEPHFFFLVDADGNAVEDSARLARDVLLWDEGGVAYRLEGDFELDDALGLADDLRLRD